MSQALGELGKLNDRWTRCSVEGSRMFNPGWHLALDLHSMLTISEAVAKSALVREESRGAHSRIDFPETSAEWGTKNNIISPRLEWRDESSTGHEIGTAGRVETSARRGRRQMKPQHQFRLTMLTACARDIRVMDIPWKAFATPVKPAANTLRC